MNDDVVSMNGGWGLQKGVFADGAGCLTSEAMDDLAWIMKSGA